ncbi:hypothetical protein TZ02_08085 [Clostridium aceticum]|nr:hypothetical protein TZ02_08085 [Clostridium aceticum]
MQNVKTISISKKSKDCYLLCMTNEENHIYEPQYKKIEANELRCKAVFLPLDDNNKMNTGRK